MLKLQNKVLYMKNEEFNELIDLFALKLESLNSNLRQALLNERGICSFLIGKMIRVGQEGGEVTREAVLQ